MSEYEYRPAVTAWVEYKGGLVSKSYRIQGPPPGTVFHTELSTFGLTYIPWIKGRIVICAI